MDCGSLSRSFLLLASSPLCKFYSFCHKGGKGEKNAQLELLVGIEKLSALRFE